MQDATTTTERPKPRRTSSRRPREFDAIRVSIFALVRSGRATAEQIEQTVADALAEAAKPTRPGTDAVSDLALALGDPALAVVTSGQAAILLGVSMQTVNRMCDRGEIPFFRVPGSGRHRRIYLADVERYLAENRRETDEEPPSGPRDPGDDGDGRIERTAETATTDREPPPMRTTSRTSDPGGPDPVLEGRGMVARVRT